MSFEEVKGNVNIYYSVKDEMKETDKFWNLVCEIEKKWQMIGRVIMFPNAKHKGRALYVFDYAVITQDKMDF